MPIPMQELVTILGPDKAFELVRRFEGAQVPASSSVNRYARDQEIRRLWSNGVSLPVIADRLGVSYSTTLRAIRQQ